MNPPKLTIVMSVYNSEQTLGEALESIVHQTFTDWEFVICDDGSTDGTARLLREFAESLGRDRVTVLTNESNRKLAYSLNRCLGVASGELIARMDGDDISEPDRLARQVQYLDDNPEVDLVGTTMRRFNTNGLGDVVRPASLEPQRRTLGTSATAPFCHATIVARRAVFETIGNYTDTWWTERAEDLDLWFKFFRAGFTGVNVNAPLYRVREDEAAIRRRTPRNRLAVFVTRVRGYWSLGFGPRAYTIAIVDLLKILMPYRVFDWHRTRARNRAAAPGANSPERAGRN